MWTSGVCHIFMASLVTNHNNEFHKILIGIIKRYTLSSADVIVIIGVVFEHIFYLKIF